MGGGQTPIGETHHSLTAKKTDRKAWEAHRSVYNILDVSPLPASVRQLAPSRRRSLSFARSCAEHSGRT